MNTKDMENIRKEFYTTNIIQIAVEKQDWEVIVKFFFDKFKSEQSKLIEDILAKKKAHHVRIEDILRPR